METFLCVFVSQKELQPRNRVGNDNVRCAINANSARGLVEHDTESPTSEISRCLESLLEIEYHRSIMMSHFNSSKRELSLEDDVYSTESRLSQF